MTNTTTSQGRRALLSVYDKTGIVELAQGLHDLGWDLVSSGGTASRIADAGIPVTDVADYTGSPTMLGHRVVTLHPRVHGGILADRDDPQHQADLAANNIDPIDLVVGNLYPFGSSVADFEHSASAAEELIDIGGPTMVRAAAKNHAFVGVLVNPGDYGEVLSELQEHGEIRAATRRSLARRAFAHTAAYDASVVTWFDESEEQAAGEDHSALPDTLHLALEKTGDLRYGENPHQVGARYRTIGGGGWWETATQHGGKGMSFLNVFDTEAAHRLAYDFADPTVAVIKHANPCGLASNDDITTAYKLAHEGDPVSAFGGIVAVNRPVPLALAEALSDVFTEVIVAPAYEPDALAKLLEKKNLRVLEADAPNTPALDIRTVDGGLLVQTADHISTDRSGWTVATDRQPTETEWLDLEFAWQVAARVSSNTIVLAKDRQAVGIGAGQQNRRDAGRIAAEKAAGRATGGACASDAFFPFKDGLEAAIEAGATAVIQPGGSIRDDEVIEAANAAGMAMVFTGTRHFKH